MFIDSQLQFASSQALTATAASTNIIDLGVARNLFDGTDLCVVIVPLVSADITTGDETYAVAVETAIDAAFTSPVSLLSQTIAAAGLVAKTIVCLAVPPGAAVLQYLRLKWTLGGTTPSITYEALLMPQSMVQKFISYKDNSPIN